MKIIGIVGSRRRDEPADFKAVWIAFLKIYEQGDKIVSGGCPKGGDRFAEIIARILGLTIENGGLILFPADWKTHGKRAGFIRNTDIAQTGDVIIACVAPDRTGGTEDTLRKARTFHKDIIIV
jgi:hypothetical protein